MENKKPAAFFEHREYFYTLISKSPAVVKVSLYSTDYTFVRDKDGNWINHHTNKNNMAAGLIIALINAISI